MKKLIYTICIISVLSTLSFRTQPPAGYTLVVFEGSDWCVYCEKFNKDILSDKAFTDYLEKNDIQVVKVDFPQRIKQTKEVKERNRMYAERYNFEGIFPTLVITGKDNYRKLYYKTGMQAEEVIALIDDQLK